ncbi:hypothetical protein M0R45_027372 [Rubus argutus]|uniref:Uncharacterized protein n=1 Tax=Rubus argutus TaxID=59490 RepID=A0AAW1X1Y1_RUBAR
MTMFCAKGDGCVRSRLDLHCLVDFIRWLMGVGEGWTSLGLLGSLKVSHQFTTSSKDGDHGGSAYWWCVQPPKSPLLATWFDIKLS